MVAAARLPIDPMEDAIGDAPMPGSMVVEPGVAAAGCDAVPDDGAAEGLFPPHALAPRRVMVQNMTRTRRCGVLVVFMVLAFHGSDKNAGGPLGAAPRPKF
ncbi:hypothetical protein GCM10027405_29530 [Arthrobacter alkaliphilus]